MTTDKAYRKNGLAGAPPYAREDGTEVSPGEELRRAGEDMKGLHELFPEFHDAWLAYPREMPRGFVEEDFFWAKLNVDQRPTFTLSHRIAASNEEVQVVGIRDFYVSHFFDVLQRVAIVTQLDSGEQISSMWNGPGSTTGAVSHLYTSKWAANFCASKWSICWKTPVSAANRNTLAPIRCRTGMVGSSPARPRVRGFWRIAGRSRQACGAGRWSPAAVS